MIGADKSTSLHISKQELTRDIYKKHKAWILCVNFSNCSSAHPSTKISVAWHADFLRGSCSACASIHHTANSSWHVVKFGSDRQPEVDSVLLEALPDVVKSNVLKVKSAERYILGLTAFVDSLKAADSRLAYSFTLYTAFWRYISMLRRHVLFYLSKQNRVRNSLPYSWAYFF